MDARIDQMGGDVGNGILSTAQWGLVADGELTAEEFQYTVMQMQACVEDAGGTMDLSQFDAASHTPRLSFTSGTGCDSKYLNGLSGMWQMFENPVTVAGRATSDHITAGLPWLRAVFFPEAGTTIDPMAIEQCYRDQGVKAYLAVLHKDFIAMDLLPDTVEPPPGLSTACAAEAKGAKVVVLHRMTRGVLPPSAWEEEPEYIPAGPGAFFALLDGDVLASGVSDSLSRNVVRGLESQAQGCLNQHGAGNGGASIRDEERRACEIDWMGGVPELMEAAGVR